MNIQKFHLFLDFDGVLVTKFSAPSQKRNGLAFDPACIHTLESMLEYIKQRSREVVIVIISNWRFEFAESQLESFLREHDGIDALVSDIKVLEGPPGKSASLRAYIERESLPAGSYIILEDEDLGDELRHAQIRTRYEDGLRDQEGMLLAIVTYMGTLKS